MADEPGPMINTEEAAARLGVTPRTLRWMVDRGEIEVVVVGRSHRYSGDALDDFLARQRVTPGTLRHLATPTSTSAQSVPRAKKRSAWQVARQQAAREARARRATDQRAKLEQTEAGRLEAERIAAARVAEVEARRATVGARYVSGESAERIARDLRIGVRTVYTDLQRAGVPRRGKKSQGGVASYANVFTEAYLIDQYVTGRRSVQDLAREIGCSESTVLNWLRRYDIAVRGRA